MKPTKIEVYYNGYEEEIRKLEEEIKGLKSSLRAISRIQRTDSDYVYKMYANNYAKFAKELEEIKEQLGEQKLDTLPTIEERTEQLLGRIADVEVELEREDNTLENRVRKLEGFVGDPEDTKRFEVFGERYAIRKALERIGEIEHKLFVHDIIGGVSDNSRSIHRLKGRLNDKDYEHRGLKKRVEELEQALSDLEEAINQ